MAYALAEKEVCCIEEQYIFDQVYSLVRLDLLRNTVVMNHGPLKRPTCFLLVYGFARLHSESYSACTTFPFVWA